ncbi:hypothetical protein K490DRAFT_72240 [Saccharata proteae CBS 121410]|uniref:MFS general substrate transporter n=1 Tax=Saccharata proteae CBS 121410 TaxID=1314787 RepID=A0A6A5YC80_9PEZI|nr:hypothetical protein K490DRAFT_72240 [Saccharata proteae CBS 121410]
MRRLFCRIVVALYQQQTEERTAASCQDCLLLGYDQFGRVSDYSEADMQGIITSIYDMRFAFGSLLSFVFAEHLGRKKMILAGGITMIISPIILTSFTTIAQLLVGRVVTGIAIDGLIQWRLPVAFRAFFAICLVLQIILLTETARFLIEHDYGAEAAAVLARLDNTDSTDEGVIGSCRIIEISIAHENKDGLFKYRELIQDGNMIKYYAPVVDQQNRRLSRTISLILGGCTSLKYLVGPLIPLCSVDRFGRRALLMFFSSGLCFCSSTASILLSIGTQSTARGSTAIITPIAIQNICWRTFVIFAVFIACWVPVVYAFVPETNALELEYVESYLSRVDGAVAYGKARVGGRYGDERTGKL